MKKTSQVKLLVIFLFLLMLLQFQSTPVVYGTWDYEKKGLQNLNQRHEKKWGDNWCVPTAVGISLAWFAEKKNYPNLVPDLDDPPDGIDKDDKYKAIDDLGDGSRPPGQKKYLKTSPSTGTLKANEIRGVNRYIKEKGYGGKFIVHSVLPRPRLDKYKEELKKDEDIIVHIFVKKQEGIRKKGDHALVGHAYNATHLGFVNPWGRFVNVSSENWPRLEIPWDNLKIKATVKRLLVISPMNLSALPPGPPDHNLTGYVFEIEDHTYVVTGEEWTDVYVVDGVVYGVPDGTAYNTTGTVYGFANGTVAIYNGTYFPIEGNISIVNGTEWITMFEFEEPVGGIWVPVDKFGLLAPYIALASTVLVATATTAIYVKRVKRRKKKQ